MSALRDQLNQAVKDAMRAKDRDRLTTLRMATAALKQIEVDERITPDETRVIAVFDKMIKQRKDSAQQFDAGDRKDLADKERFEIEILQAFMPAALTDAELDSLITQAISSSSAEGMKDMGKVMGIVNKQLAGKADGKTISTIVKQKLG